jgi:DNA-binding protein H-NS
MLDQTLHRRQEAALSNTEKLAVLEAEVSRLRSGLKEVLENLEHKHEQLWETVAKQGDELAELEAGPMRPGAGRSESAASRIEQRAEGATVSGRGRTTK